MEAARLAQLSGVEQATSMGSGFAVDGRSRSVPTSVQYWPGRRRECLTPLRLLATHVACGLRWLAASLRRAAAVLRSDTDGSGYIGRRHEGTLAASRTTVSDAAATDIPPRRIARSGI